MSLTEQIEEQLSAHSIERNKSKFIDDQQLHSLHPLL